MPYYGSPPGTYAGPAAYMQPPHLMQADHDEAVSPHQAPSVEDPAQHQGWGCPVDADDATAPPAATAAAPAGATLPRTAPTGWQGAGKDAPEPEAAGADLEGAPNLQQQRRPQRQQQQQRREAAAVMLAAGPPGLPPVGQPKSAPRVVPADAVGDASATSDQQ